MTRDEFAAREIWRFTVTTKTDSIWAAAEHLLRRDAEELRESSTSSRDRDDWTGEEEAKADYDEHIAAADALASLSTAEPVQPLYGWVLVPAKPTREWIGAVADDGYADCDVAQLIASILSHAPAAPAAVAGPSWEALHHAWMKIGADVAGLDWGAFTNAVHYAPTTQAAPAAALPEQDRARGAQGESE